jgi:hypothetical protein
MLLHHRHGTRRKEASKQRKKPTLLVLLRTVKILLHFHTKRMLQNAHHAPKSIIDPVPSRRLLVRNSNCCLLSTSNQFFFFISILRLPRRPHPPPGKNSPPISLCNNVYVLDPKDDNKNRNPKTPSEHDPDVNHFLRSHGDEFWTFFFFFFFPCWHWIEQLA